MTQSDVFPDLPDPDTQAEFYADVPTKRLVAWVIDMAIIIALTLLAIPLTLFTAFFYLPFLMMVIGFVYRILTIANRSATPGMRLVAIEFRTRRGEKFDLSMAVLHTLGYTISIAMVFPQIISVILMLTSARKQGLTDMVLGSVAINRSARS